MSRLVWDQEVNTYFEVGVDKVVLYMRDGSAIAWNGVTSINEKPQTDGSVSFYLDGVKHVNRIRLDEFSLTVQAFSYPSELDEPKNVMGFTYRTQLNGGWQTHIVYNPHFSSSEVSYETVDDNLDPINFEWDVETKPKNIKGYAPSAHFVLIGSNVSPDWLSEYIEMLFYGSDDVNPEFPDPEFLIDIFTDRHSHSYLLIIDHGDGHWTALGSSDYISMLSDTEFQIDTPSASFLDAETYTVGSY